MSGDALPAQGFTRQQVFHGSRGDRVTTREGRLARYLRKLGQEVEIRHAGDGRVEVWARPGVTS